MILAIIDHDTHQLYVENVDEEMLEENYNGSEQEYINDNYSVSNYSWDYIVNTEVYDDEGRVTGVDFVEQKFIEF